MLSNSLPALDQDTLDKMVAWRHDLHRHPETGFEEHRTSGIVAEVLEELGYEVHRGLGKTGVVGVLTNGEGPSIGLRADMDALDMEELGTPEYRSTVPGKMHGCGHDGHTSILLGTAEYLARYKPFKGSVYLIFQPAEENLGGGKAMCEDGLFSRFYIEKVFAIHNMPFLPTGKIAVCYGVAAAAYDNFEIVITGKGGHGALPESTIDPVVISAQLINALQGIVSRNLGGLDTGVISVTRIHGGNTWNVVPETVTLGGTVRTLDPEIRDRIEARMGEICAGIGAAHGATVALTYSRGYPVLVNTDTETDQARRVIANQLGEDGVVVIDSPMMGSEDFAYMLEERPGSYVLVGSGKTAADPMPHNPYYDFNDEILPIAATFFAGLVAQELPRD